VFLFRTGRLQESIAELRKAVRSHPKDAAAHAELGRVLYQSGDLAPAIEHLEKALELDPTLSGSSLLLDRARRRLALQP
jgi:Flp pilus assembly protein TadD